MKNRCLIFLFLCVLSSGYAQENNLAMQQRLEYWMERNQVENLDMTHLQEIWEYHIEHPLHLNSVNEEELRVLDLCSDVQIHELVEHRNRVGPFLSVYELQTLTSWDTSFIQLILPFITLLDRSENPPLTWYELTRKGRLDVLSRVVHPFKKVTKLSAINTKKSETNYLGNNDFYLAKIRFTYQQRISFGLTAEKDVGEPFFALVNKKGFDFYSMHLQVKPGKVVKNTIVGDYHVQIGQGLNCWTSFALGKSLDLTTSKKNAQVIRPHTSTDENRFFRGVASEFAFKHITLSMFASINRKDASMNADSIQQISSVLTSGYHRTETELARKDALKESGIGGYLRYEMGGFHLGCASVLLKYTPGLNKKSNPYNQFDFRGETNNSTSLDYSYTFKNVLLFGEVAYAHTSKKTALLQGALLALDAKTSLSFLFRRYDKAYETPYNVGFSEGNSVQNESGFYLAFLRQLSPSWNLQVYSDYFLFPWLKQNICLPTKGIENCAQVSWKPSKKIEFYLRYRNQSKEQNSSDLKNGLKGLTSIDQSNIRFHIAYKITDYIEIRARLEGISLQRDDKEAESGMLFYQDVTFTSKKKNKDVSLRFFLFDTDSYASRIYSFESSPAYQFSCPAFYGKGLRLYVLSRISIWKNIDLWFKFGTTQNLTKDNSSQYWIHILDTNTQEINVQLRWKI